MKHPKLQPGELLLRCSEREWFALPIRLRELICMYDLRLRPDYAVVPKKEADDAAKRWKRERKKQRKKKQ